MKIETIAINDLQFDPSNARIHSDRNLEAIAGSLREFGQRKPIVITQDNVIAAGNGTAEAARSIGWTQIEAVRVPADWDDTRIKAFALADNRTAELADWNHEVLATTIFELQESEFDIEAIGFEVPDKPSDDDWMDAFDATAGEKKEIQQITFTLHNDQAATIQRALEQAKQMGEFGDTGNQNANGNAIARICELWLGDYQ